VKVINKHTQNKFKSKLEKSKNRALHNKIIEIIKNMIKIIVIIMNLEKKIEIEIGIIVIKDREINDMINMTIIKEIEIGRNKIETEINIEKEIGIETEIEKEKDKRTKTDKEEHKKITEIEIFAKKIEIIRIMIEKKDIKIIKDTKSHTIIQKMDILAKANKKEGNHVNKIRRGMKNHNNKKIYNKETMIKILIIAVAEINTNKNMIIDQLN
jgi:hypothetical protein